MIPLLRFLFMILYSIIDISTLIINIYYHLRCLQIFLIFKIKIMVFILFFLSIYNVIEMNRHFQFLIDYYFIDIFNYIIDISTLIINIYYHLSCLQIFIIFKIRIMVFILFYRYKMLSKLIDILNRLLPISWNLIIILIFSIYHSIWIIFWRILSIF